VQDANPVNSYHNSPAKFLFDKFVGLFCATTSLPLFLSIFTILKIINGGPVFFIQKRVGKNGKIFNLIKFRTMRVGAEKEQSKYKNLNEADGPVFKIKNDPRLTKFGKILFQTGLDELPQLINVLKGEMSIIGPRPLPIKEAAKLTEKQKAIVATIVNGMENKKEDN